MATAVPGYNSTGVYADSQAITVTPLFGNSTNFYVTRQTQYNSLASTPYKLRLRTSVGNLTIPQLGGSLTLNGRDTKIHVTDYDVGGFNILYSTAEIFTWKSYGGRVVLVVHGGSGELHELAVSRTSGATSIEGSGVKLSNRNGNTILQWETSSNRRTVRIGANFHVIILDRNSAYNYWTVSTLPEGSYSHDATPASDLIIKAGYLLRTATVTGNVINLVGDINATTTIEVVGGAHDGIDGLTFNGEELKTTRDRSGFLGATVSFDTPEIKLPDLSALQWKYVNTLPELQASYDDSAWIDADHTTTNNTYWSLTTPTILWGAEYGFNAGSLIARGHFVANGNESLIRLSVNGGSAMACSAWINETFIGSWSGKGGIAIANLTLKVPALERAQNYVLTVLSDHMGHNGNWVVGFNEMKTPRGIIAYDFPGHTKYSGNSSRAPDGIKWKITGNLGGEDYHGGVRGPLNEGALWVERNGYHLPSAPTSSWEDSAGPVSGLSKPGVGFYSTTLKLDIPQGWDIPLSFVFKGDSFTGVGEGWRAQLWVNGYQFGKFANGVGPQRRYPVPEGILNYRGDNYVGVSIWALEEGGATPEGFELVAGMPVRTSYRVVEMAPMTAWEKRDRAY